jgi:FtsP/CotA-like multicopper oxidase with cupredoxin domain
MRKRSAPVRTAVLFLLALIAVPCCAFAGSSDPCPRPAQGSVITNPPDLYSRNGVLKVTFHYYTTVDPWNPTLFCYVTRDGIEAPTLHLDPGDTLDVTLINDEKGGPPPSSEQVSGNSTVCGSFDMTAQSVNLHFHGMNVSPRCHSDEVIHTLVNPGERFRYRIKVPNDEPPGMYWYHAHVHMISSHAVQGGASGAIEIEGIANLQHAVAGPPQRFLVVRDQPLQNPPKNRLLYPTAPFWDVSLNYVPVPYPSYTPGVIQMQAGAQEFWRVVNASADTILDLQLLYDGRAQPVEIVALDGVPVGSQDGKGQGSLIAQKDVLIPPAGRAEFIVTGPSAKVKQALFMTEHIDTGPVGDIDTRRPLAAIRLTNDAKKIPAPVLPVAAAVTGQRFANVGDELVSAHRTLYFDEHNTTKAGPGAGGQFLITVKGQLEVPYYPNEPPAITTTEGVVEDWKIENRTQEVHEFHMHQIHFQVLAVNDVPIPRDQRQWYDTFQVPYVPKTGYTGKGKWPSIAVRMDFRGAVYHCHILDHEDAGMMANILVLPRGGTDGRARAQEHRPAGAGPVRLGARVAPSHV